MKNIKFTHIFLIALTLMTASCARNMSSNNYVSSSNSGMVLEGVVVSARPVTIKPDQLQDNTMGAAGGAIAGGVAGNQVGKGGGNTAATVGGALAGAVIGAIIQDQLSKSDGMEYIVKLNKDNIGDYGGKKTEINHTKMQKNTPSTSTIKTNLKTEMISVIQGTDEIFTAGQKVYVVYSDDRPRIVAKDPAPVAAPAKKAATTAN